MLMISDHVYSTWHMTPGEFLCAKEDTILGGSVLPPLHYVQAAAGGPAPHQASTAGAFFSFVLFLKGDAAQSSLRRARARLLVVEAKVWVREDTVSLAQARRSAWSFWPLLTSRRLLPGQA